MATDTKNRQVFKREQDLLDFARSYLSEAFPNTHRQGCPQDDMLRVLASRPAQGDASITDHLTCCSPCFTAYIAHLSHARAEVVRPNRIRRAMWIRRFLVSASVAVILMIAIYVFVTRRHEEPAVAPRTPAPIGKPAAPAQEPATAIYVPVVVDLSNASPVRGQGEPSPSPQVIPASPLMNLNLLLPLGSDERQYSARLSSKGHVVWSGSAQAHLENGQVVLHMQADFSRVLAGNYDLTVVSKGFRLTVPVLVQSTSSGRIR